MTSSSAGFLVHGASWRYFHDDVHVHELTVICPLPTVQSDAELQLTRVRLLQLRTFLGHLFSLQQFKYKYPRQRSRCDHHDKVVVSGHLSLLFPMVHAVPSPQLGSIEEEVVCCPILVYVARCHGQGDPGITPLMVVVLMMTMMMK